MCSTRLSIDSRNERSVCGIRVWLPLRELLSLLGSMAILRRNDKEKQGSRRPAPAHAVGAADVTGRAAEACANIVQSLSLEPEGMQGADECSEPSISLLSSP